MVCCLMRTLDSVIDSPGEKPWFLQLGATAFLFLFKAAQLRGGLRPGCLVFHLATKFTVINKCRRIRALHLDRKASFHIHF